MYYPSALSSFSPSTILWLPSPCTMCPFQPPTNVDVCSIFNDAKTVPNLSKSLTEDMKNVSLRCRRNGMAANTTKTNAMLITTKREPEMANFSW